MFVRGSSGNAAAIRYFPDRGLSWEQIKQRHLAFLDANPATRAAYWAASDPIQHFWLADELQGPRQCLRHPLPAGGLPAVADRYPWARAGQVVIANGGDLAKEAGLFGAARPEVP